MQKRALGSKLLILLAGALWGCMGLFVRPLNERGLSSWDIVFLRAFLTMIFMGVFIFVKDKSLFRIKLKDIWCFLGTGLLSIVFFNLCYFKEITITSLSVAAILLYTAPTFVMILSAILFHEKITWVKMAAVALAFAGCCLVSGIGTGTSLTAIGLLYGLGAGIGYALYTIFSRFALQRGYSSSTINFYSCLLAALGAFLLKRPQGLPGLMTASLPAFLWCLGTGVLSCFVPYMLYTYSLTGLENGRASILASVEPVVASLLGVFVYHEKMTLASAAGVLLVLSAILLLNLKPGAAEGAPAR